MRLYINIGTLYKHVINDLNNDELTKTDQIHWLDTHISFVLELALI